MIKPDESAVTVFRVEVRPIRGRMWVWRSISIPKEQTSNAQRSTPNVEIGENRTVILAPARVLQRFHRLRFFDFRAALLAGTPLIGIPEIELGLPEVLNHIYP